MVGTLPLMQKDQTRGHSTQWNSGIWWWGQHLWYKKVKPEDAVDAVHSGIMVYGGGDIVFGAKRSNQRNYHDAVCSGIVVYGSGDIVFGARRSNQWMQYTVRSGIVVYGGGDIVLWCKKVKPVDSVDAVTQWTQYTVNAVDTVCSGRSRIVVYCGGDIVLWCKKVKPVDSVDAVTQWTQYTVDTVCSGCSGIAVYGGGDIVFGAKRSNQWIQWMQSHSGHSTLCDCIHWFDLFAPNTIKPVPTTIYHYSTVSTAHCILWFGFFAPKNNVPTTIYHYSTAHSVLRTASTGLTILHQRQCPHHHIPLFHCILRPLVWSFCTKDNVPTIIYHYSTAYCIHCILWFDLFAPKTMSLPPYTTSTVYCVPSSSLTFYTKDNVPTIIYHYATVSTSLTFLHQHLLHTVSPTAWGLTFLH